MGCLKPKFCVCLSFTLGVLAICAVLVGADVNPAAPNQLSVEKALELLKKDMAPVTGVDADFRQVKKLAIFSKELVITGKMTIRPPRLFKWEISSPLKSSVVVKGDSVITWDEETDEKRTISLKDNPVAGGVWAQMDAFFMGSYDFLRRLYDIELTSDSPLTLRFTPRSKPLSTVMRDVTLVFGVVDGRRYLKRVTMFEKGGDYTTIDFLNLKLSTATADSLSPEKLKR